MVIKINDKEKRIKIEKTEQKEISENSFVKVTKCNHILDICYSKQSYEDAFSNIRKIDANNYFMLDTGEIRQYKKSDIKDNHDSLRRTFKRLRLMINANFEGNPNELFLTLTYRENMTDKDRLYNDFKYFMKKLKKEYGHMEYIAVAEPQERGAWHLHILVKSTVHKYFYMPIQNVIRIWGHGEKCDIQKLEKVDNIGAYLTAYLTNLKVGEGDEKKFIKGARLSLYPPGMNLYRTSRGIVQPETEKTKYSEIKKIVGAATPNYSQGLYIKDNDNQLLNHVIYEQYNMKNPKK